MSYDLENLQTYLAKRAEAVNEATAEGRYELRALRQLKALVVAAALAPAAGAAAAPPVAPSPIWPIQKQAVSDAIAGALGEAYDCTRVWSAWSYGTMGPDDFSLVAEDSDRVEEITSAALEALGLATTPTDVPRDLPDSLDEHLVAILGRPNFACAPIAQVLRAKGRAIPRRAEHEQAAVIHYMLSAYLRHGEAWADYVRFDLYSTLDGTCPANTNQEK